MKEISKCLFVCAVALCGCLLSRAQKPAKLYNELGLTGNVKTMAERTFEALDNFGKPEKGERGSNNADYTFLPNGDIAEQNIYNQNGSLRTRHVYLYNSSGKLTEQNLYNPGGPLRVRYRYRYNGAGALTEQQSFKPDGSITAKYVNEYNKHGDLIKHTSYNNKNKLEEKIIYTYDSAHNQIGWQSYDGDSVLLVKAVYVYNLFGNMIEENLYDADGNLEKKSLMIYDANNRVSTLVEYAGNYLMVKTVQFKYDVQGNITDEMWYDKDNNVLDHYSNKYTYDKKKNWTKKMAYRNEVPVTITERELTYFK